MKNFIWVRLTLVVVTCFVTLQSCRNIGKFQDSEILGSEGQNAEYGSVALNNSRIAWLKRVTYDNINQVPVIPSEGCSVVNFIIELPIDHVLQSHTAMAIDNYFFDFGPLGSVASDDRKILGSKDIRIGGYFWSAEKKNSQEAITFTKFMTKFIRRSLSRLYTIISIPVEIPKDQGQKLIEWWQRDKIVQCRQEFSIPGHHCTSMVIDAFKAATNQSLFFIPSIVSPLSLAEKILGMTKENGPNPAVKQLCGPYKGQYAKAAILNAGLELTSNNSNDFVNLRSQMEWIVNYFYHSDSKSVIAY